MKILFEPFWGNVKTRSVYIDGQYFTELRNDNGVLFTDTQHKSVNLPELFSSFTQSEDDFLSINALRVETEIAPMPHTETYQLIKMKDGEPLEVMEREFTKRKETLILDTFCMWD